SAVTLTEVGEVILIEDKSPDNALQVCRELERDYRKVRCLTHPNNANMGAGASRNLGVQNAAFDFIAFLDADDWYLPERFSRSREIFLRDGSVDGVYEATAFFNQSLGTFDAERLTTVKKEIDPKDLLLSLLLPDHGRFHTNAITVKKKILIEAGMFDVSLRLHQDTHLWLKLAHLGKLVPGSLENPVAVRRQHAMNRIQHSNHESRKLLHQRTFEWFDKQTNVDPKAYRIIFNRFVHSSKTGVFARIVFLFGYLIKHTSTVRKLI